MTEHPEVTRGERIIRRIRQRIPDYYDRSERFGRKATRIIGKLLARAARFRHAPAVDEWGATAADRCALARQGICWHD